MGLQRLSAESKHRHMSHKSAVFLLRWSATLPCAQWSLGEKGTIDTNQPPHYTDISSPECKVFEKNICKNF